MVNRIAIIPARSGSKGLPDKNVLMLLDKPLIAYTIEAALDAGVFDRVIVSTDSAYYKEVAESFGAEVILRDASLATDTATSYMVIEDVIAKFSSFDYFVLLQPTSPFRTSSHIQQAVELFDNSPDSYYLVSVVESSKPAILIRPIDDDLTLKHFDTDFSNYRRQQSKEYSPNGAIFIASPDRYLHKKHFFGEDTIAYIMDKESSIDIDEPLDFEIAIAIASLRKRKDVLHNNVIKRINEKRKIMQNNQKGITLLGHSLFDFWNIDRIKGYPVDNFSIAGITTRELLDEVIKKNLISGFGNYVFIFSGSNDIVLPDWHPQDTLSALDEIIEYIIAENPHAEVFILSTPAVRGRLNRSNETISLFNDYLGKNLHKANFLRLSDDFNDAFGNLKSIFTDDGLHFTSAAYNLLKKELEHIIQ